MSGNQKILFSDYFGTDDTPIVKALEEYGAFNISLLSDLSLFIDPFLLFNSTTEKYQELHLDIIHYLAFLRDKSVSGTVTPGLRDAWYLFSEVKQTWLGFTVGSNRGRGLGPDFARALDANLVRLFSAEEAEPITLGNHLEKLCLLGAGVGKDSISDFTTNLICGYLAEYTQDFARTHLAPSQCRTFHVGKARFNYETEVWEDLPFYLPRIRVNFPKPKDDYVLLVPRNLLTRDDTWINQEDLINSFEELRDANTNEALRDSISNYLFKRLPKAPKRIEYRKAVQETIREFPILIDYYIRLKEATGDQAVASSDAKVEYAKSLFLENFTRLATLIFDKSRFYEYSFDTLKGSIDRAMCLKYVIESEGGYQFLYNDKGRALTSEDELAIAHQFIWFNTPQDDEETKPVDPRKAVRVHFKLATNSNLHTFFDKRNKAAIKNKDENSGTPKENIIIVFYFSESEKERVQGYISQLSEEIGHITLINASRQYLDEGIQKDNIPNWNHIVEVVPMTGTTDKVESIEPPRVFISYSHDKEIWKALGLDPETQRKRVFDLAKQLRNEGVDCIIDQHIVNPPEGWPRWMMNNIESADFVIVIATEAYNRRFRGQEEPSKGYGAQWEGAVITQELYNANGKNEKFIPIIFDHVDAGHIPLPLQGATHYNLSDPASYDELYFYLTHQLPYVPTPLGPIRLRPFQA